MSVDERTVEHLARLACLRVEEERVPQLARELSSILDHMEALSEADTSAIAKLSPMRPTHLASPRQDVVARGDRVNSDAIAPEWRDGFFLVPRLATHDRDS